MILDCKFGFEIVLRGFEILGFIVLGFLVLGIFVLGSKFLGFFILILRREDPLGSSIPVSRIFRPDKVYNCYS